MPTPLLHTFVGVVMERLDRRSATAEPPRPRRWLMALLLVVASNAPDLDFVPGLLIGDLTRFHRGPSHSLLAAALMGVMVGWMAGHAGWGSARRVGALASLAVLTHLVLDMMSSDLGGIRHGVELFWPVLRDGIVLPAVFVDLSYDPDPPNVLLRVLHPYNAYALAREWAIVALVIIGVGAVRSAVTSDRTKRRGRSNLVHDGTDIPD